MFKDLSPYRYSEELVIPLPEPVIWTPDIFPVKLETKFVELTLLIWF
jgi:hypothetical protein